MHWPATRRRASSWSRGRQARIWVGSDAGKGQHWAAAVDESGFEVWSKKIDNDEAAILEATAGR
ncbi:hypothetical protein GCM10009665_79410 [Kitasatospora nipponensis]|uniref:Transposase n=1 Tax=Kitasatospora nipponensis TaxID=258049 RepID=A0ABP4DY41_9ACTN